MSGTTNLEYLGLDDDGKRMYVCPVCHTGTVKIPDAVFYGDCSNCHATVIDYKPLPYQKAFHSSPARYKLLIGGYGTGKTTQACSEIARHAYTVPNGKTLITGPTIRLINDAVMPELRKFLSPKFIRSFKKSPAPYFLLENGHEIHVYASNDSDNLRSLNLTAFYIEEASQVDKSVFDELQARLRNKHGVIRDKERREIGYHYIGIVSTNPEEFWGKQDFLFVSSRIFTSKSVDPAIYERMVSTTTYKDYHSFISSTRDNPFLHSTFIESLVAGKSPEWVRAYIDAYLDRRFGAVFPEFAESIVEPFKIPASWLRIAGYDPGFADPTAFLIGAIDPMTGIIYFYDEHYEREKPLSYHAKAIKKILGHSDLFLPVQADPSVRKRNERDGISHADYFYSLSKIVLEDAVNDIAFGIEKVRDYMYQGKVKIFSSLTETRREGYLYMYKDSKNNVKDEPVDKDNHLMDCMRYAIARLPRDPNELSDIVMQSRVRGPISDFWSDAFAEDDENGEAFGIYGGIKF